ncbi:hypothetical protein ACLI4Y_03500 [Natrialbaceae archaeon A-CW3]
MASNDQSFVVASLVYIGAVILIGLPSMVILYYGFGIVLEAIGLDEVFAEWGLLFLLISLLIGLQLAVEAAAVQLGGIEALGRGDSRVALVRYVVFAGGVFVLLAAATWVGLSTALAGFGWVAVALGLLVGLAGLIVLYRSSRAFITGFSETEHTQP